MDTIFNGVLYSIGWFGAVFFGGKQLPLTALFVSFLTCSLQLGYLYYFSRRVFSIDWRLTCYAILIGFVAEAFYLYFGVIKYATEGWFPLLPPLWVLALYPIFSLTLNHSFNFLNNNVLYPLILSLFVPYTYFLASQMNACSFPYGSKVTMLLLVPSWAIILTTLRVINQKIKAQLEKSNN